MSQVAYDQPSNMSNKVEPEDAAFDDEDRGAFKDSDVEMKKQLFTQRLEINLALILAALNSAQFPISALRLQLTSRAFEPTHCYKKVFQLLAQYITCRLAN
jgi:hypothetical protein